MKKFILLILLIFTSVINLTAQDNNSPTITDLKNYVDSLSTKLNTLQHDYDYLYCSHEINLMQLELKDFINNIDIKSNALFINCYHSRYDIDLYTAYRDNYNSSIDLLDSMKGKTDAIKEAVALKILTSNFTNNEMTLLMNSCSFLDKCLSKAQHSLDYFKVALDMYKDIR